MQFWLWMANFVSACSPATRGFNVRRRLFLLAGAEISASAKLCGGVRLDNRFVKIGDGVWVGGQSRLIGARDAWIQIGDNCDLGPQVMLVTGTHGCGGTVRRAGRGLASPITLGAGCWVGARATILPGVTIGTASVVAAGSVVTRDVPESSLVAGVPARVVRTLADD